MLCSPQARTTLFPRMRSNMTEPWPQQGIFSVTRRDSFVLQVVYLFS